MSDNTESISFQGGSGQPSNPSEGGRNADAQYLTRKDAETLKRELLSEVDRKTQSLTDKAQSRIERRVNDRFAEIDRVAKMTGMTADVVERARQQAVMEEIAKVEDPASDSGGRAAQPEQQETRTDTLTPDQEYVNRQLTRKFQKYGFPLAEDDPEVAELDLDKIQDPDEFLQAVEEGLQKKKQRLGTSPAARIPSMGTGTPATAEGLIDQYKKEMMAARGNREKVLQVKEAFRKRGVPVDQVNLFK
jgi:hypothetical protein